MSFFQNVFDIEYYGCWMYGDDVSMSFSFKVPGNKNGAEAAICWNTETYNLSSVNTLTFNYAIDKDFKNFSSFSVNVAGATASATKAEEIVAILNANTSFTPWFTASVYTNKSNKQVLIKTKKNKSEFRWYISNSGAETILGFNKKAGIADIPKYFQKHTIANRFSNDDANPFLIRLTHDITGNTVANPTVVTSVGHGLSTNDVIYIVNSNCSPTIDGQRTVTRIDDDTFSVAVNVTTAGTRGEWLTTTEYNLVTNAGFTYSAMKDDHEHLQGKTGAFVCYKNTVNGSNQTTQQIIYNTGSVAGDLAKKVIMTYSGANTNPSTRLEMPYILQSGDILSP
jgi:hypothetical protein